MVKKDIKISLGGQINEKKDNISDYANTFNNDNRNF